MIRFFSKFLTNNKEIEHAFKELKTLVRLNKIGQVRQLLAQNPHQNDATALAILLHEATEWRCPEIIQLLIDRGANVNNREVTSMFSDTKLPPLLTVLTFREFTSGTTGRWGNRTVTLSEHVRTIKVLLQNGADISQSLELAKELSSKFAVSVLSILKECSIETINSNLETILVTEKERIDALEEQNNAQNLNNNLDNAWEESQTISPNKELIKPDPAVHFDEEVEQQNISQLTQLDNILPDNNNALPNNTENCPQNSSSILNSSQINTIINRGIKLLTQAWEGRSNDNNANDTSPQAKL